MSEQITTLKNQVVAGFGTVEAFELLQRQGLMLSKSSMLPDAFKNNVADCSIALEMSARMGNTVSPLSILQSIVPVFGKPTFEAKFIIGLLKARCGYRRFDYEMSGEVGDAGEVRRTQKLDRAGKPILDKKGNPIYDNEIIRAGRTCLAYAIDRDGNRLDGVPVSMAMAKVEGWYDKNGSKWQTMPELMLRYRAATFFKNIHCPEITMGFRSTDEAADMVDAEIEIVDEAPKPTAFRRSKPRKEEKPEAAADVPQLSEKPAEEPKAQTAADSEEDAPTVETPDFDDAPEAPKAEPKQADEKPLAKLKRLLAEESLTEAQCKNYCRRNGMLAGGKVDEFAATRIINAWDTVAEFIAKMPVEDEGGAK